MFYLYIKRINGVDLYKLQKLEDREPILQRLSPDTVGSIFIGEAIYKKLDLDGKTLEEQYEILTKDF